LKLITKELKQEDLKTFAEQFILDLSIPSVIGLKGTLGAGKTTLVKHLILELGVQEKVTSPTFNIVKTYKKGKLTIFHVDLYRLSSIHEFLDLDLPLNEEDTVFFIEWSDMVPESKSKDWRFLDIEIIDDVTRKVRY
jgi:tRNA threonylcarbamoyladenosine biosynthesis protein TsaE